MLTRQPLPPDRSPITPGRGPAAHRPSAARAPADAVAPFETPPEPSAGRCSRRQALVRLGLLALAGVGSAASAAGSPAAAASAPGAFGETVGSRRDRLGPHPDADLRAAARVRPKLVLPEWVQPRDETDLWASASPTAPIVGRAKRPAAFPVLGAEGARLEVRVLTGGTVAWINVADVVPARPPDGWAKALAPIGLWSGTDGRAQLFTVAPAGTGLRLLGPTESGRALVYVPGDQGGPKAGAAWVDLDKIAPAAPETSPYLPPLDLRLGRTFASEREFIEAVAAADRPIPGPKLPTSVTIAQAILESDWGRSRLARDASNYFGIKATSGIGPAGVIWLPTWEVIGGADVTVLAPWRVYHSLEESVLDHARFLQRYPRYREALSHPNEPRLVAELLQQAGYATDPAYPSKLVRLMDRWNLYQYD